MLRKPTKNQVLLVGLVVITVCANLAAAALISITVSNRVMSDLNTALEHYNTLVLDAYNTGRTEALRTNPASEDLEMACVALWNQRNHTVDPVVTLQSSSNLWAGSVK